MDAKSHNNQTPLDEIGVPQLPCPSNSNKDELPAEQQRQAEKQTPLSRHNVQIQWVLALCGLATVLIYGVQAWLMRETLKEAIRTANAGDASSARALSIMQHDLRAWVVVSGVEPPPYEGGGWRPSGSPIQYVYLTDKFRGPFVLVITNTGKTPARDVRYAIKREWVPRHAAVNWSFFEEKNHGSEERLVIAPSSGGGMSFRIDELPPLTARQMNDIKGGSRLVRVLTQVDYKDIFGERRRTRSCLYLMADLSHFSDCPMGNELD